MSCGIYIHIPFCTEKCDYCSFYSIPVGKSREYIQGFIEHLVSEMLIFFRTRGPVSADTVYFGGGTPSILEPHEIARILQLVRDECDLAYDAEISLELNPCHVETCRLESYRDCGVNRMVLGIQSFDPESHRYIGRCGDPCTISLVEEFISVKGVIHCADIICGIPVEKQEGLIRDLNLLSAMGIKHISCYTLTVEKDTPLGKRFLAGDNFDELQAESFLLARRTLRDLGFHHYEISNYTIPGYESRHNMKYWRFDPYIAFGPGGHSFYKGERWQNPSSIDGYMKGDPRIIDVRTENDCIVEYYLAALRRLDGVPMEEFKLIFGYPVPGPVRKRIMEQVNSGYLGLLTVNGGESVSLTEKGILHADSVIYQVVRDYIK